MTLFKRLGAVAVAITLLLVVGVRPAHAALVTFTTTGAFGSTGTNILEEGDQTITFLGVTEVAVDVSDPGWFGSFGSFFVTTDGNQSTGGLNKETFTLTITQVLPPGQTQFPATLNGQINFNNSNATLTFTSPLTHEIDGFFYTVTTSLIDLPEPTKYVAIGGHVTGDQASTQVPEPASLLLLIIGSLAAVPGLRRTSLGG